METFPLLLVFFLVLVLETMGNFEDEDEDEEEDERRVSPDLITRPAAGPKP